MPTVVDERPSGRQNKTAELVSTKSDEIRRNWVSRLTQAWANGPAGRIEVFQKALKQESDSLSYLQVRLSGGPEALAWEKIQFAIERVQSEDFRVSDLMFEVASLKQEIHEIARTTAGDRNGIALAAVIDIDRCLDGFLAAALQETADVYEYVAESGERALCILDGKGVITYANRRACTLLGSDHPRGKMLAAFIVEEDRDIVTAAAAKQDAGRPKIRELRLKSSNGEDRIVSAEVAPLEQGTGNSTYYVAFADNLLSVNMATAVLDKIDLGVARVDQSSLQFTYMNSVVRKMFGMPRAEPVPVYDIVTDPEDQATIKQEINRRRQGDVGIYQVKIARQDTGRQVPVRVIALPERNAKGDVVSALAFFQSREIDEIKERLNNLVHGESSSEEIFEAVSREVTSLIPSDQILFSTYSRDFTHGAVQFAWDCATQSHQPAWTTRWYALSHAQRDWMSQPGLQREGDLEQFFKRPPWDAHFEDSQIQAMLYEQKIRSFLNLPVWRDGRLLATLTLQSKNYDAYDKGHEDLLSSLPVEQAVLSATASLSDTDEQKLNGLIKQLIACRTIPQIAEALAEGLAAIFRWDNVAVFRVDSATEVLQLKYQANGAAGGIEQPEGMAQSMELGNLGLAARKGENVYVANVDNDPNFVHGDEAGPAKTKSQLAVPISLSKQTFWVLNIEDSHYNAFSDEEIDKVAFICDQVARLLDGLVARYIYDSAFRESADAIFITDSLGQLRRLNPAAESLLGYGIGRSRAEGRPSHFADCLADPNAKEIVTAEGIKNTKVALSRRDGEKVNVLLSMFQLPQEIKDKYYIAKSLVLEERLAELEGIREVYDELAAQIKTPITILYGLLRRLHRTSSDTMPAELLHKAMNLLRRMELTYDHLAYYDPEQSHQLNTKVLIDLKSLIEDSRQVLARSDHKVADMAIPENLPYIVGDPYQLGFVFQSIFGYLFYSLPLDREITLHVEQKDKFLEATMQAPFPSERLHELKDDSREMARLITEVALGKRTIERFVKNHGGEMEAPQFDQNELRFRLRLPVAKD